MSRHNVHARTYVHCIRSYTLHHTGHYMVLVNSARFVSSRPPGKIYMHVLYRCYADYQNPAVRDDLRLLSLFCVTQKRSNLSPPRIVRGPRTIPFRRLLVSLVYSKHPLRSCSNNTNFKQLFFFFFVLLLSKTVARKSPTKIRLVIPATEFVT